MCMLREVPLVIASEPSSNKPCGNFEEGLSPLMRMIVSLSFLREAHKYTKEVFQFSLSCYEEE
jgi:hypothetical protein